MAFKQAGAGFSFAAATAGAGLDQTSEAERASKKAALEAILGVLLSAGYFRARIPQLPPFDKVVGGLCWAISSSGAAVDVDLFYDDELTLGQKIQLCDVVVKVLREMSCPTALQAFQIQGSDFVAIFPVVQWLVKKVIDHRKITGDYVRLASETAFNRSYAPTLPRAAAATATYARGLVGATATAAAAAAPGAVALCTAAAGSARTAAGAEYAEQVAERYAPQRRYRRHPSLWRVALPAEARVQSCLLEFGERTVVKAAGDDGGEDATAAVAGGAKAARGGNDFERKFAALQRAARREEDERRTSAVERERGLLTQMLDASKGGGVSGSQLGALVGLQSDELRRAAEEYRIKADELRAQQESGDFMANTKLGRAAAHARRVGALQKRVDAAEESKREQEAAVAGVAAEIGALRDALAKAERYNARATGEIAKLDAQVEALPPEQKAQLRSLFDLYTRAEALRDQEGRFKAACAEQLADLQARLARLHEEAASGEPARRLAEMAAAHADATARLERARGVVAEKLREVARLTRLIDEIPSRAELLQYEKRFLELFDQVSEKLDETRKYFAIYNTLAKKREFMGKEETLVTSMLANFSALKNKVQRQSYLDQCAVFVKTIEDSLSKQTAALDAKRKVKDTHAAELQKLIDAQRAYFKAVKEFQEECDRNEALNAAMQRRQAASA